MNKTATRHNRLTTSLTSVAATAQTRAALLCAILFGSIILGDSAHASIHFYSGLSEYHVSFADNVAFSDASAAFDFTWVMRADARGDTGNSTFRVRTGFFNYSHNSSGVLTITSQSFTPATFTETFSLQATDAGFGTQYFHYDTAIGSNFSESSITIGNADGFRTLEFSGGGFLTPLLESNTFDVDLFLPGDWSQTGTTTGKLEFLGIDPAWTIVKNFQYDGISGTTEFFATNTHFNPATGNSPNLTFRLYGEIIPEPSTVTLLGIGAIGVAVSAARSCKGRCRRNSSTSALISLLFTGLLFAFAAEAQAVNIETVPVGNAGNGNDPLTGNLYGGVSYDYRIGTTEVTVGQYTAFLNAVAAADTYLLYNTSMATDPKSASIARSGAPGSYTYSVIGSPNKPVTYVSWGDAARFVNWLNNGQPSGAQNAATTEGGTYTLNGAVTFAALSAVARNAGATWFIPTENEWYKAAHHQPASQGGDADNYWLYPTGTNTTPYSDQAPGTDAPLQSNTANYFRNDELANGFNDGYAVTGSTNFSSTQNYLTDVGAYTSTMSPYGTFDQCGNVWEWNEALVSGTTRGLRGGSWVNGADNVLSLYRGDSNPAVGSYNVGFRVATVPEPSTVVLLGAGAISLAVGAVRRRKRKAAV